MSCPFCDIARAAAPAQVAFRSRDLVVFADHRPIRPGHVQIIPRQHVATFDELAEPLAHAILSLGQRIARAQKRLYGTARVGFVFTGNEVAHCHAHLIPLHAATDITSLRYYRGAPPAGRHDLAASASATAETARRLSQALAQTKDRPC